MRQTLSPTGRVHVTLSDPRTKEIIAEHRVPNLVTTAGRTLLADLLTSAVGQVAYIKLAVGGPEQQDDPEPTAPSPEDTQLVREVARVRAVPGAPRISNEDTPRSITPITAVLEADLDSETLILREAGLLMFPIEDAGDDDGGGDGGGGDGDGGGDGAPPAEPEPEGILYNRVVFPTIIKEPQLQMTLTWEVIF